MLIIAGIIVACALTVWLLVSLAICSDMRDRQSLTVWGVAKVFAWPVIIARLVLLMAGGMVLNFCGIENDWWL